MTSAKFYNELCLYSLQILSRSSLRIRDLTNATETKWVCTAANVALAANDGGSCVGPVGRRDASEPRAASGADNGLVGAIALAVVSCGLLLAAVGGLLVAHRTGKLEPYI